MGIFSNCPLHGVFTSGEASANVHYTFSGFAVHNLVVHGVFVLCMMVSRSFLYFNAFLLCGSIYSVPLLVYTLFYVCSFHLACPPKPFMAHSLSPAGFNSIICFGGQFPCSSLFPCTDAVHLYSSELCGGLSIV